MIMMIMFRRCRYQPKSMTGCCININISVFTTLYSNFVCVCVQKYQHFLSRLLSLFPGQVDCPRVGIAGATLRFVLLSIKNVVHGLTRVQDNPPTIVQPTF
jgi:hypothetical protein